MKFIIKSIFIVITCLITTNTYSQIIADPEFITYNYLPFYSNKVPVDPIILDSLNICRTRENKIRTLAIYKFRPNKDSILLDNIEYDSLGGVSNIQPKVGWFKTSNPKLQHFPCRYKSFRENNSNPIDTTIKVKDGNVNITTTYDQEGFITFKTIIKRGLIKYHNTLGGQNNWKDELIYSKDHTYLRINSYADKWTKFSPETRRTVSEYEFDKNGNLILAKYLTGDAEQIIVTYKFYYNLN